MNNFPPPICSWLKTNGEFIECKTEEHFDYLKINAKHLKIDVGSYTEGILQFMRETKWIRVRRYESSKQIAIQGIKPFTKDQRNAIKDLEIFGYTIFIQAEIKERNNE